MAGKGADVAIELGTIEGYYGAPWSWAARRETIRVLAPHGYNFYHYAPKADAYFRKRWREPLPDELFRNLSETAAHCRALGVRFGVGLSPFEIFRNYDDEADAALSAKLAQLDALGLDDLAILFDDMRGDMDGLAQVQADIMHRVAARTKATRLIMCPSYYTDDPGLDAIFGQRPENYLEDLGRALDPAIEVFWTGEEVCSREYSPGHLARVAGQLGRKPFLWDNYPVNDGPRMSQFLYLRAMTGRPGANAAHLAAHAVNPALQAALSRIPMLTLAESYERGEGYEYLAAFSRAAEAVLGPEMAKAVRRHLPTFQDTGRDLLDAESVDRLRKRYAAYDNDGAREIVAWLDGAYKITRDMMEEA